MQILKLVAVATTAAFPIAATADTTTTVKSAYVLCGIIDGTGLVSSPCKVFARESSVVMMVDMNSAEARKLCPQMADLMKGKGDIFDKGWTLQIKSPFSGENSIAYCPL